MTEGGGSIKAMGFGFRWMDFFGLFFPICSCFTVLC